MIVTGRGLSLSPQEGEEHMAEEQVSVQRFYPSSCGQAQDLCDFSPGLPHYHGSHPLRKEWERLCLAFQKHSWWETFCWLLTELLSCILRLTVGTQHPPPPNSGHLPHVFLLPFRPEEVTSRAAFILTCPLKEVLFLHVWDNTQRRVKGDTKMNPNNKRERKRKT